MNRTTSFTAELDQTDEDILYVVSDETLEAAAGTYIGGQAMVTVGPTIMVGGCCSDLGGARPPQSCYSTSQQASLSPAKTATQLQEEIKAKVKCDRGHAPGACHHHTEGLRHVAS